MLDPQTTQAALDAGQGLHLSGGAVVTLVGLIVTNVGLISKDLIKGALSRRTGNGLSNADKRMLQDHDRAITRHEAEIKAICKAAEDARRENREDHRQIFDKLEEIAKGR